MYLLPDRNHALLSGAGLRLQRANVLQNCRNGLLHHRFNRTIRGAGGGGGRSGGGDRSGGNPLRLICLRLLLLLVLRSLPSRWLDLGWLDLGWLDLGWLDLPTSLFSAWHSPLRR